MLGLQSQQRLLPGAVWISGCCVHSLQRQKVLGSGVRTLHINSSSLACVHCQPLSCTKLHVPNHENLPCLPVVGSWWGLGKCLAHFWQDEPFLAYVFFLQHLTAVTEAQGDTSLWSPVPRSIHSFSSSEHKADRQATLRKTGRLLNMAHTLAQCWSEAMRKVAERQDVRGAALSGSVLSGCRGFVSLRSYPLSTFASSIMGDSNWS